MGNLPPAAPITAVNRTGRECESEPYRSNDYCLTDDEYIAYIYYELKLTPFEVVLLCLYALVFVVGLLGNILVIRVILRTPQMRTATNLFLLNLAVADFFVISFCLVPTVIEDFAETWVFTNPGCRVLKYLQPISVTVSVLTLTFNSVERLLAICFPLSSFKATKKRIRCIIAFIWTVALASNLHYPFKMQTEHFGKLPDDRVLLTQCHSTWKQAQAFNQSDSAPTAAARMDPDTVANVVDSVFFFVLPLTWMLIAYTLIWRRLWYSIVPGEIATRSPAATGNRSADATLNQRRRTAMMLIAIVLLFFVCYLPVHLLRAAQGYITKDEYFQGNHQLKAIIQNVIVFSHWSCYFNSAINPIVYTFMSSRFRAEFLKIFSCCQCAPNDGVARPGNPQSWLNQQSRNRYAAAPANRGSRFVMQEMRRQPASTSAGTPEARMLLPPQPPRPEDEDSAKMWPGNAA